MFKLQSIIVFVLFLAGMKQVHHSWQEFNILKYQRKLWKNITKMKGEILFLIAASVNNKVVV